MGKFIAQYQSHQGGDHIDLGFTFSFPVQQTAIDRGSLINWTKGFSATGAQGEDVPGLLQTSLDRKQIPVRVSALVNDTVGTLLSRGYQTGQGALCGAIFGTGTNGAFLIDIEQITKPYPVRTAEPNVHET